jgi:galactokinase
MMAGLAEAGVPVQGFDAQVSATLPPGGGLSSSASFEMAVGRAIEALAGAEPLPPLQLAAIGARADLGRPTTTAAENKAAFMAFLQD